MQEDRDLQFFYPRHGRPGRSDQLLLEISMGTWDFDKILEKLGTLLDQMNSGTFIGKNARKGGLRG